MFHLVSPEGEVLWGAVSSNMGLAGDAGAMFLGRARPARGALIGAARDIQRTGLSVVNPPVRDNSALAERRCFPPDTGVRMTQSVLGDPRILQ